MDNIVENLIKYQEIDSKLKAIEDEINGTELARNYGKCRKYMANVQNVIDDFESKSSNLLNQYNYLISEIKKINGKVVEYKNEIATCDDDETPAILDEFKELMEELNAKGDEVKKVTASMDELSKNLNKFVSQYKQVKAQYAELKPQYDELKGKRMAEMDAIKAELEKIEKETGGRTLERYKEKRKDKIFPVCYEVNLDDKEKICPRCKIGFSLAFINDLKNGHLKDCESCRCILYIRK